jgi:hypothetical protein
MMAWSKGLPDVALSRIASQSRYLTKWYLVELAKSSDGFLLRTERIVELSILGRRERSINTPGRIYGCSAPGVVYGRKGVV